jgi:hypothetical protein
MMLQQISNYKHEKFGTIKVPLGLPQKNITVLSRLYHLQQASNK